MVNLMDWSQFAKIANSTAIVTWLTLLSGALVWLLNTASKRRVRVRGADAFSSILDEEGKRRNFHLIFTAYNNQSIDVGIHYLSVTVRRKGFKRHTWGLQHLLEAPPTLRAQHSHTFELSLAQISRLVDESFTGDPDPSRRRYKIEVKLGNGRVVRSRWLKLPAAAYESVPEVESSRDIKPWMLDR